MTIVAISREMGSGGYEIAAAVAKALNFEYVDREILMHAARVHEVPEEKIVDVADRHLSLWERFDEEKRRYLIFIEAAYYAFAEKGNVVTAGRGGPFFLRGVSHALRVRITAPVDIRVRRVMEREKLDQRTATAKVRGYDKEMAARIDYLFGLNWRNPDHFDLVLNTGGDMWDFYTDLIVAAVRHPRFQVTPESLQRVKGLSLAAQVRAAIARDPVTKNINVEVSVEGGHVALKGVVFSPSMMDSAAAVAKKVPGVSDVSCEAVEIPRVYPGPIM
ncbi:MAG: cytidylate kinase family protein [candidate division NC10 bacterium]|nr:cytidylate kinase family protein [candidate division NC10 bacterium]